MAIITLITDMGHRDFYVSAVKGAIYSVAENAKIVDISHHIPPFDIAQASFVLKNAYKEFPKGSIHIIGVNPEKVKRKDLFDMREEIVHLVVEKNGHFFIGADNGIFSLLFEDGVDRSFEITIDTGGDDMVFPTKNVFAKIAGMLFHGTPLEEIGLPKEDLKERSEFRPIIEKDLIKGTVIYIDSYGNVISNITFDLFEKQRKNRNFSITFRSDDYEITEISKSYDEVPPGEKVALFNSSGHLEIAINKAVTGRGGGAASLFGISLNDSIRIEFN